VAASSSSNALAWDRSTTGSIKKAQAVHFFAQTSSQPGNLGDAVPAHLWIVLPVIGSNCTFCGLMDTLVERGLGILQIIVHFEDAAIDLLPEITGDGIQRDTTDPEGFQRGTSRLRGCCQVA